MKILIVEDEYYSRKRLVKMVREWNSSVIVTGDVETGIEAVNSIRREQPDIVITDIRMPEMDGLELSRYVREHHPSVFIGIISGYADFEYAREAIKYQVKGYLLKPIKKDDLYELLDELKEKWEELNRERQQYNTMLEKLASLNQIWKLTSAIYERNRLNESPMELFKLSQEPAGYWVIVFKIYSHQEERDVESLKDLLKIEPTWDGFIFINPMVKNEWIGICFTYSKEEGETFAGPSELTETMISHMRERFHDRFSIGVSRLHASIDLLSKGYREAKYALAQHLCCGAGRLYEYGNLKESNSLEWKEEMERKLQQELKAGKAGSVKSMIHTIFTKVQDDQLGSIRLLQHIYSRIDAIIRSEMDEQMIQEAPRKDINEFASLDQLVEELAGQVDRLCDRTSAAEVKEEENQELINDLIAYVKENYACEISLEVLAKHRYYLNSSYLSRLFKSKTGQGFSDFLIACRMNKAKELIETNWFSISEISGLVGYTKPSYFIFMFKKYYGKTPGDYKSAFVKMSKN